MDIGRDNGLPVDLSYADKLPFAFTGTVKRVIFDIPQPTDRPTAEALHREAVQSALTRGITA
jgi:arylsulfatase